MLILLILGAMNLLVMIAVAAVIASEKLLPNPKPIVRLVGVTSVVAGIITVIRSVL